MQPWHAVHSETGAGERDGRLALAPQGQASLRAPAGQHPAHRMEPVAPPARGKGSSLAASTL